MSRMRVVLLRGAAHELVEVDAYSDSGAQIPPSKIRDIALRRDREDYYRRDARWFVEITHPTGKRELVEPGTFAARWQAS